MTMGICRGWGGGGGRTVCGAVGMNMGETQSRGGPGHEMSMLDLEGLSSPG